MPPRSIAPITTGLIPLTPEQALRCLFCHANRVELPPPAGDPTGRPLVLDATELAREREARRRRWVESIVLKLWRAAERERHGSPSGSVRT